MSGADNPPAGRDHLEYLELQRAQAAAIAATSDLNSSDVTAAVSMSSPNNDSNIDLSFATLPPRTAMNKLIMNYLVTEGFKEAAEKFQDEAGLPAPPQLSEMDNRISVRDAIQSGRIGEAISLVHELHPELLDDDRYLFFHLQQQQLIELIRERRIDEALRFASDQLAERGEEDPSVLEELERTMALLAFEEPINSPFADLLSHSHRQKVASELNSSLLRAAHIHPVHPKLAGVLKMLLWVQDELDRKGIRYSKTIDLNEKAKSAKH